MIKSIIKSVVKDTAKSSIKAMGISWSSYWKPQTDQFKAVYNTWTKKPPKEKAVLWDTMIKILVDSGVWDTLDVFFNFAIHTNDNGEALVDWKDPTDINKKATLHGNVLPAFTPYVGFAGNSAQSAYINTHWNPRNGVNYQLNNASFGTYLQEATADNGYMGVRTATSFTRLSPHTLANGMRGMINGSSGDWSLTGGKNSGLFVVNRIASTDIDTIPYDYTTRNTPVTSSDKTNGNFYLLAENASGTAGNFIDRPISNFFAGSATDSAKRDSLRAALSLGNLYGLLDYGVHTALPPMLDVTQQHGFEACNGKLYSIGGAYFDDNYEYDPATYIWKRKALMPNGDVQSPILRAVGNKLYFIGGLKSGAGLQNKVYEYDPSSNTYTLKTAMPTAREDFGSAVVGTKIYCFGGITASPVAKLEIYDTVNNTWSDGQDMPDVKCLGDFGCSCNGYVYAISASDRVYGPGPSEVTPKNNCYKYNPSTNTWSQIADIPIPVVYSERAVVGNYIYVVGGVMAGDSRNANNFTKIIQKYDTINNVWSQVGTAPYQNLLGAGLAELNGDVYMCGGGTNNSYLTTCEFYKLKLT